MAHSDIDYLEIEEDHDMYPIVEQHEQIIEYLIGKDVRSSLDTLYEQGEEEFRNVNFSCWWR
ncbi:hypothetical protein [Fuchsiella alkaliacetigena]|uniref:hypothetical protein n=1 Tax=Fuchsiella alkaliacetigena TaxID=957042 RepID=UPI00200AE12E|nr:hypothetical protein [Fuchsiella alkaliacetigena]